VEVPTEGRKRRVQSDGLHFTQPRDYGAAVEEISG